MEICEWSFKLVEDHLLALEYTGPVGLSCDNTKLFAALRLYWDAEKKAHFLVGGVDGPCRVANPEQVMQVIEDAKIQKATKVRITWLHIVIKLLNKLCTFHRYGYGV